MKWVLGGGFIGYTLLSWVLLFRDERALVAIANFYPQLGELLSQTRNILLGLGLNSAVTFLAAGAFLLLFYAYFRALQKPPFGKTAVVWAVIFQAIVFFSYPVLSTDIFDYILTNRLALVHKENVWLTPPAKYPGDPFYNLASWQSQVSPYGIANQALYSIAGKLAGSNLIQAVFVHKLLVFILVLVLLYLLRQNVFAVMVIFWNPLFVLETAGSGHNIILPMVLAVTGYLLFQNRRYLLSGTVLALAVHTKFLPLFLAGFLGLELLRRKEIKSLAKFAAALITVNFIILAYFGATVISYLTKILFSYPIYWQSLPQLVHKVFPVENYLFPVLFVMVIGVQAIRIFGSKLGALTAFVQTILVYFLFLVSFYWNWYCLWLLALVPFLPWGKLSRTILVFTFSSALAYPLYWFSLRFGFESWFWPVIMYLFIAGSPAGYYLYETIRHKA